MARARLSDDMLKAIQSRNAKKEEDTESIRDRQILSEILNGSNKIAIDGRFGPATSIEISEFNFKSLSENTQKRLNGLFDVKYNEELTNKVRVFRDYDEMDIEMYIKLIGKDYTREKLIKHQEYFVAI